MELPRRPSGANTVDFTKLPGQIDNSGRGPYYTHTVILSVAPSQLYKLCQHDISLTMAAKGPSLMARGPTQTTTYPLPKI